MREFKILACLLLTGLAAPAQQRPHYTQYILNNYILNPALSGIENYTDIKISGREQWRGLPGSPTTFYLSVHAPLGKSDQRISATSFSMPGENPRGSAYWENYTAAAPHQGVGLSVVNDRTGNFERLNANISYAYHLGLSATTNIALGVAGGVARLNYNRSNAAPADPNDPAIGNANGVNSNWKPDLNTGVWIYSRNYFAGFSAQQVIPQNFQPGTAGEGIKQVPHWFATAGYRVLLTEDVNVTPSAMLKFVSGTPSFPQFDLNVKFQYRDILWAGGSYRLENGFAAMLGMKLANTVNLGYAYDFTQTVLNTASRGTHELVLGFILGNKYGDTCPRNVW